MKISDDIAEVMPSRYIWWWFVCDRQLVERVTVSGPRLSHIVKSCPLTKLNGGLSQLHSVDEDAVSWQTSYGSW